MDIDILRILDKTCCEAQLRARKKEAALHELVTLAKRHPLLEGIDENILYDKLVARESQGSTGLGGGLAIPHASFEELDDFMLILAVSKRGVRFDAMDKHKVHIFTMILGPAGHPKLHIQLLAQISHVLRDERVRWELTKSPTSLALYESFTRHYQPANDDDGTKRARQKLLILVLQKGPVFEDVVEYITELGITGAAVIDSTGMSNVLSGMPLFASFIHFLGERSDETRTMLLAISDTIIEDVIAGIEGITGDLDKHTGAMIMVIEPTLVKGTLELL